MRRILAITSALFLAVLPALSQAPAEDIPYTIEFNPEKDVAMLDRHEGKDALFIKVKFVVGVKGNARNHKDYKIQIFEDGKFVKDVDLPAPKPDKGLSVILAVDTSAKIKENFNQLKQATDVFFKDLPKEAECGLILFNEQVRQTIDLSLNRGPLLKAIRSVEPSGGNACLDATARAIAMLKDVPTGKGRAVVLISNGLDRYSKAGKEEIITAARKNDVIVHTIGIGEATKPQNVNIVLVLDRSGSMSAPADDDDPTPKIQGLHLAAKGFIETLPPSTRTTLIPFDSVVDTARPFRTGDDKKKLIDDIDTLKADGETALFDALFSGLATLEADNHAGKRVVVAMTDGIDNKSRRRVEEVVERAKDMNVQLYLLGFGRDKELDAATMTTMAEQTGGQYFHARNQKALLDFFKHLAVKINEQGIDAATLQAIASRTHGKYNHAKDVKSLPLILKEINQALQNKDEEVIFPSQRQVRDGKLRNIALKLVRTVTIIGPGGQVSTKSDIVTEKSGNVQTHGVVIAEMNHLVYLTLLGVLGSLIVLPTLFRKTS